MQLALSTTITPPSIPVRGELSGNLRQGFATKNPGWNPGSNVVNSTTAIGFWPSLFLEGIRQSHSARYYNPLSGRFMSRDPNDSCGCNLRNPIAKDKYIYGEDDPVDLFDPTGRAAAPLPIPPEPEPEPQPKRYGGLEYLVIVEWLQLPRRPYLMMRSQPAGDSCAERS